MNQPEQEQSTSDLRRGWLISLAIHSVSDGLRESESLCSLKAGPKERQHAPFCLPGDKKVRIIGSDGVPTIQLPYSVTKRVEPRHPLLSTLAVMDEIGIEFQQNVSFISML
jgi:hypothetical protein